MLDQAQSIFLGSPNFGTVQQAIYQMKAESTSAQGQTLLFPRTKRGRHNSLTYCPWFSQEYNAALIYIHRSAPQQENKKRKSYEPSPALNEGTHNSNLSSWSAKIFVWIIYGVTAKEPLSHKDRLIAIKEQKVVKRLTISSQEMTLPQKMITMKEAKTAAEVHDLGGWLTFDIPCDRTPCDHGPIFSRGLSSSSSIDLVKY